MTLQLAAKNISVATSIPEDASVEADLQMVETILRNLLGNAIKFSSPSGAIEIIATPEPTATPASAPAPASWTISITDHGIGMTAEMASKLFKTSTASSDIATGTHGEKGHGLGLLLCREMIEKCGGTISCTSKVGEGSTFSFTLHATPQTIRECLA